MMAGVRTKIILGGYIVGGPLGGLVWHHLQYIIGLDRLGYDVLFVEDSNDYPSCYNPITNEVSTDPQFGLNFISSLFEKYGLKDKWSYYNRHSNKWEGVQEHKVKLFAEQSELFLNLSGIHPLHSHFQKIKQKIFLDTDPLFTQIKHLTDPAFLTLVNEHNHFFTFAENIHAKDCTIPIDNLPWKTTRQPVVPDIWANTISGNPEASWTTVMQWDSYKSLSFKGQCYGMKSKTFKPYFNLPENVQDSMELAIGSSTAPKELLHSSGWNIVNPLKVALTPENYKNYIRSSKGEWSVAKEGYVKTNSGWFSERSAAYLASGRPVVVQETGFSSYIPVGEGLFSFNSLESAIEAIRKVNENYPLHCTKAVEIANAFFNYKKVLSDILSRI